MSADVWSDRADLYVLSDAHREGEDLDTIVEWSAGARTALDVATGGGHVARRLREAGLDVVTSDPAPGMRPDVICAAESLPFAESSIDEVRFSEHEMDFAAWLERTGCEGDEAERVTHLLGDRVVDGRLSLAKIAIKARKGF